MTAVREHTVARDEQPGGLQPTTRLLLVAFITLTLVATNQLFVLAPHTATLFSWTIQPPISAAFAARARELVGVTVWPALQPAAAQLAAAVRTALPGVDRDEAEARGRAMPLLQGLAYAVSATAPEPVSAPA